MDSTIEFVTEIHDQAFPALFRRFEDLVGPQTWCKRTHKIDQEVKGNPILREYLREENEIAYALRQLSTRRSNGRMEPVTVQSQAHYDAYALVAQFMGVHAAMPPSAAHALVRRLQGAFRKPGDLRALCFEWLIATNLIRRGYAVTLPELVQEGTFDLLATKDGTSLEIGCKSVPKNKGNRIHRRDALQIWGILKAACARFARTLHHGMFVRVIVPDRLPTAHSDQERLVKRISQGIIAPKAHSDPDLEIHIHDFDLQKVPLHAREPDQSELRTFVEKNFGVRNKNLFVHYASNGQRALIISLESARSDNLVAAIFDTVSDACDRQLTGRRAGIVCIKLEAITAEELEDIGAERGEPTALRTAASRFLEKRRDSHLTCLGFFSDGPLQRSTMGVITRGGRSYFFENRESPYYDQVTADAFHSP